MIAPAPRPRDNPFRTERIDGLAYRLPGLDWDDLVDRLLALRRAAVVGPHGSGKSRFLATLAGHLRRRGLPVVQVRLDRPAGVEPPALAGAVVLADGLDSLGPLGRYRFLRRARAATSLLCTVHAPCRLPTLHRCRVDATLLAELVDELAPALSPALRPDLPALLDRNQGDARASLRALYDLVGGRRRGG